MLKHWLRTLRLGGKRPRTLETYGESVRLFCTFAANHGVTVVTGVTGALIFPI